MLEGVLRAEMESQGGGPAQGESGDARPLAREGRERVMWQDQRASCFISP